MAVRDDAVAELSVFDKRRRADVSLDGPDKSVAGTMEGVCICGARIPDGGDE